MKNFLSFFYMTAFVVCLTFQSAQAMKGACEEKSPSQFAKMKVETDEKGDKTLKPSNVTNEDLKKLTHLKALDLTDNEHVTDGGIKGLTNLTSLSLPCIAKNSKRFTDDGIRGLTNITRLYLYGNYDSSDETPPLITDAGLKGLKKLTHLKLASYYWDCYLITDKGIMALINLIHLSLESNACISDDGIKGLTNLTALNLTGNTTITDEGIRGLNLMYLYLNRICEDPRITDEGLGKLTSLLSLSLKNNTTITDTSIQKLTNLTDLDLTSNDTVTDNGVRRLINLATLIGNEDITDDGIKGLTNLTSLQMRNNYNITDEGIRGLTNLTRLYLNTGYDIDLHFEPHRSADLKLGKIGVFCEEDKSYCQVQNKDKLEIIRPLSFAITEIDLGILYRSTPGYLEKLLQYTSFCGYTTNRLTWHGSLKKLTKLTAPDSLREKCAAQFRDNCRAHARGYYYLATQRPKIGLKTKQERLCKAIGLITNLLEFPDDITDVDRGNYKVYRNDIDSIHKDLDEAWAAK